MAKNIKHLYEFGPFRLDAGERLLLREGEAVPLTPKAFDLLLVLVEHRGHLLEKEELMKAVWPDSFVEENNLADNIFKLRKVLGEDRHGQRFIETVPKRGYRFVAPVREEAAEPGRAADAQSPVTITPQAEPVAAAIQPPGTVPNVSSAWDLSSLGKQQPGLTVLLVVLLLIGATGAIRLWGLKRQPTAQNAPIKSIAVLPFKPLVTNNRDEAFELGMADTLITRLSSLKQLIVRPTSAIRKYSSLDQDPLAAGREQRVEAVLEGSLHRAGEKVRVNVRLLDTKDGSSLWSYQSDEYFTDIFTAQDTISDEIARALALELTGAERTRLAKRYTENTEAYQAYTKGRYFWDKRTEEGFQKAIEYFQQAIGKDPKYALAYAGLADCHNLLGGFGLLPPKETYPRGKAAAMKALELDEQLAEAHTALAFAKARYDWDQAGAGKDFKRAIELNPGYATAHQWYAHYSLIIAEKFDEAIAEVKLAQQIDPLSLAISSGAGSVNYYARRFDQAIEQSGKTLEMDPHFNLVYEVLAKALEQKGRYEEAIAAIQKGLKLSPGDPFFMVPLGRAYAVSGRQDEARKILDQLNELSKRRYVRPRDIASIYTALGDKEQAFAWLQKAYEARDDRLIFLKVDAVWDSLRSDPRFAKLVGQVGLPQ